jgi:hypothetical protein
MRALLALVLCGSAHSAVIGVADTPAGSILLHDTPGICVGDALYAEWVPHTGPRVAGCWTAGGPSVNVVFLDGDLARIPPQAVKAPKGA